MYRVLVVDDDTDISAIVSRTLNQCGFETVMALNGAEAIAAVGSGDFDLVITDILMDGMDGLSLAREIRNRFPEVAIIVMTGHGSMDSAIAAIRSGACDYLVKPFEDLESITRTVHRALDTAHAARDRNRLINTLTESNKELRDLAIRDGLTGIYNHRHLLELLAAEFGRADRYQRSLSLLFVDVDYFKIYNDQHGHQQGDKILRAIAGLLQEHTRQSDAVGRWGGEEFVVVTPETTVEAAIVLAEKLRTTVAEYQFPGREGQPGGCVSVSIGIATMRPNDTEEMLIERADKALYQAKLAGRNAVKMAA